MLESVEEHSSLVHVAPRGMRVIKREVLMQGARELFIDHNGELYRLSVTKAEKLILNKNLHNGSFRERWVREDNGR